MQLFTHTPSPHPLKLDGNDSKSNDPPSELHPGCSPNKKLCPGYFPLFSVPCEVTVPLLLSRPGSCSVMRHHAFAGLWVFSASECLPVIPEHFFNVALTFKFRAWLCVALKLRYVFNFQNSRFMWTELNFFLTLGSIVLIYIKLSSYHVPKCLYYLRDQMMKVATQCELFSNVS